jgi:DNA adenine methylase
VSTAIKPILKYPGAKWNLAPWIISHFPAHAHYVEPYFGSGAVFFNKAPAKHEVINDLSGDVVNLFRVIREDGERLAALIEMTPYSREECAIAHQVVNDPLERARRFIVKTWQAHGAGEARGGTTWSHSLIGDRYVERPAMWRAIPPRVLAVIERLRDAEIEHRSAAEMIPDYAAPNALIYADPPYPLSTRNGKMYQHEMTDADHLTLLDALDAHPGPVVLSGYHCALYDERLRHWHTREKQAQAEKGNTRTEVLWLNQTCIDRLGYGPMFDEVAA